MHKRLLLFLLALPLLSGCGGSESSAANSAQTTQKAWVRAHLDDVYLWYDEIVDIPSGYYPTAPTYFDALLVRSRDNFSFSMPEAEADSRLLEGVDTGYGVMWGWSADGRLYAYYVDPNSPAASSVTRGTEVTAINGRTVASLSDAYLDETLFPSQSGTPVSLTCRAPGTSATQTRELTSATFPITTVGQPLITTMQDGSRVGYLLFNEHLYTSEQELIDAMQFLKQQGIDELVLDMRYNPGGYLFIAEEAASMIGGAAVQGKIFERLLFNDKHPEKTNNPANTFYFSSIARNGMPLPLLGLSRVFVLTGSNTCSASEAVINGLLPHVQVIRIGWTTCGKPYGFHQTNHDQQAYFAIQTEGVNAHGTNDFKHGFAPTCEVEDDLNYQLGDTRETYLNAALYYMSNNSCPPAVPVSLPKAISSETIPKEKDVRLIGKKRELKIVR